MRANLHTAKKSYFSSLLQHQKVILPILLYLACRRRMIFDTTSSSTFTTRSAQINRSSFATSRRTRHPSGGKLNKDHPRLPLFPHAFQRFANIMIEHRVHACRLPHLGPRDIRAVCFTEMTAPSLSVHAENYSPWGVAFHKSFLFNNNGANPVLYARDPLFEQLVDGAQDDHDQLRYMTPLRPRYANDQTLQLCDYTHEREWRTPGPVPFSWDNSAWICVPNIQLFQALLPVLYKDVTESGIVIKCIVTVPKDGACDHGYRCPARCHGACDHGDRCPARCRYTHTGDEKTVLIFLGNEGKNFDGSGNLRRV
mmetsp:Transcript_177778/g.564155  ORF Transcript_177778/g.564155 Transcript_177778/m.564155 type:complete len:311 (+) Transcript_177778:152-1084(+)